MCIYLLLKDLKLQYQIIQHLPLSSSSTFETPFDPMDFRVLYNHLINGCIYSPKVIINST